MDVSLSAKSQTLTLISCLSSSTSPFSSLSSPPYRFHREFLGCSHRLRPSGFRSRKKCKTSWLQIQSPRDRFILRASQFSEPIVVIVAVVAVSALTVVYLNFTRKGNNVKKSDPDPKGLKNIDASKEVEVLLKQGSENQTLDLTDVTIECHMLERDFRVENSSEHIKASEVVQQKRTSYMHGENFTTEASESSGSDVFTSNTRSSLSTDVLEGMPKVRKDDPDGVEYGSNSYGVVSKPAPNGSAIPLPNGSAIPLPNGSAIPLPNGSSIPVSSESGEIKQDHKPNHVVHKAINLQIPGYGGLFKESFREELHMFYEENRNSTSTRFASHSNNLSSLHRTNILHDPEVSVHIHHHSSASVTLEGQMPVAHCNDGSSTKRKDYGNSVEYPRNMRKGFAPQTNPRSWAPQTNGIQANNKIDQPTCLNDYNRLLRDGRLTECIEVLESMEQNGLLDMDKIYHVKFFNICKSQKAVKEAFRFVKLIGNPTLSTFNLLLSVCASSHDSEGAFQVLHLVKEAGLRADCKLYTTLISTCAKSGKVDTMFKVFHEMVNAGVEPNLHTYGALIDGCARAGQVAKAFGAYGILRSKNVKPDRVVFNALITACGQSGAVDRAFDVLAEMKAESTPVDPDHVTVGALIKTCSQAGQFDRAREVYKMIHKYKIKGTPEVYTIAVASCSQVGDLEFALSVYRDMTTNGVIPDEMFFSALVDVAGHAGDINAAFEVVQEARTSGIKLGNITYDSLMGACSNSKNWQKALELYEDIKSFKLRPTVSMLNALITALCDGEQLERAVEVLTQMKKTGVSPNIITYSILLVGSEKKDDLEVGCMLYSQAKKDRVAPNLVICKCLIGMCLRRLEKAHSLGEQVLSFKTGNPQVDNEWASLALTVYHENIAIGVAPTMEVFSLVLGCMQFPRDTSSRVSLVENLGVSTDASKCSNLKSLIDGFGEYDPRSFSLLEEATSHGIVPGVSFKGNPIVVDARKMQIHTVEVYLLTVLKGLKHRLAAGTKLPNINILLPVEKTQVLTPKGEKTINLAGRVGQAVGALFRRLGLRYQGNESYGKIRINGLFVKRWFQPKLAAPFSGKPPGLTSSYEIRLGKGIADQQRDIRMSNLSLE